MIKYNFIPSGVTWAPNEGEKKKLCPRHRVFLEAPSPSVSEYSRLCLFCVMLCAQRVRAAAAGMLLT